MSIQISHDTKSGRWTFSYSRHVFVAVGSAFLLTGLAALAAPWWLPLLLAGLGRANITIDGGVNLWVAIPLIVIGLGFLAVKYFGLDPHLARVEQDRASVAASPPNVDAIGRYFADLLDDHSYRSSFDTQFQKSYTQFAGPAKALQDNKTAKLFEQFASAAFSLHSFVGGNFFVYPNNQGQDPDYRYCLAPHLNMDRDMVNYEHEKVAQYDALKGTLGAHVEATRRSYDAFITRLKELRHI